MTEIFTPKPFSDITADMIEQVRGTTDKLTDFNVGSVTRTLLEANAVELDDYYQAMYFALLKAIPTAIYIGFGFDLRPAVAASGLVQVARMDYLNSAFTLAAGAPLVSYSGAQYLTDAAVTMAIGQASATVSVTAVAPGSAGNTGPESLMMASVPLGYSITNPYSIINGLDAETEDQRAERFAAFVKSLARGTIAAVEYGAGIPAITNAGGIVTERAQRVSVYEEPGHVMLYIHNGGYGASQALVDAVQLAIDGYRDPATLNWVGGYRPAGMRVEVRAMVETPINLSLEVTRRSSLTEAAATTAIRAALERKIRAFMPNQDLRPIDIINGALMADGITKVTVLSPTSVMALPENAILYLNDLTLTWTV